MRRKRAPRRRRCARLPDASSRSFRHTCKAMPRILTIEDDAATEQSVVPTLASTGFTVDVARSGREGIAMVMAGDYDVVALERRLPDLDGLTIVTTMRGVGIETPVL